MRTCDDFYSIMAVLAREMLEFGLMEPNHLVQVGFRSHNKNSKKWIMSINLDKFEVAR